MKKLLNIFLMLPLMAATIPAQAKRHNIQDTPARVRTFEQAQRMQNQQEIQNQIIAAQQAQDLDESQKKYKNAKRLLLFSVWVAIGIMPAPDNLVGHLLTGGFCAALVALIADFCCFDLL